MAKKAPKKKLSRKSKRIIRRSIAAVLMVTAIGVAAIPVPDIQADNGTSLYSSSDDKRADIVDDRTPCVYDVNGANGNVSSGDVDYSDDLLLDTNGILTPPYPVNETKGDPNRNTYRTYRIRKSANGSEWELNWQFKYYLTDVAEGKRGIISQYNNSFLETEVNLGNLSAIEYYTVPEADYEKFYKEEEGSETHTLTYNDYVDYKEHGEVAMTEEAQWFNTYLNAEFVGYWKVCKEYYDASKLKEAYDAWVEAGSDPTTEPQAPPSPMPTQPTDLSVTPDKYFTPEQKYKFYCDMDSELRQYGSGYTLIRVIDASNTAEGISNYIYVVNGKGVTPLKGSLDEYDFLVKEKSVGIVGIADEAFAGVTKIDTIILPDELIYLGDGAFYNSFIKSINLNSVENVGNRAFKNCTQLKNITFTSAVKNIGAEAFSNIGATSITFTYSVEEIGPGAFSNCKYLQTVNMEELQNCQIDKFAFFNCYDLDDVSMYNAGITKIGDGAFAVSSGVTGSWVDVVLPAHITAPDGLGDWLFAGRSNLNSVVFPSDMGSNKTNEVTLPSSMFNSCAKLKYIEFPDTGSKSCGYITYSPCMFLDITNKDFYVRGPETRLDGEIADPRKATWSAVTAVSDFVPYVYKDGSGVEYYEVSDGNYLLTANAEGVLTSCRLNPWADVPAEGLDLIIPDKVGNYKINSLASDCFSEDAIREAIGSLTIEDDSISEIADGTFKNLQKLHTVEIGNSVDRIGNEAFDGCKQLTKVTFHTPETGYTNFEIGTNAFRTGGTKLTFCGDIIEGYAPFDWAMKSDNYVDEISGTRVCYKSLSPTNLTVLYNNATGDRTLVDYPKYENVDQDNAEAIHQIESAFYQQYGESISGDQDVSQYVDRRNAFFNYWNANYSLPLDDPNHPYNQEDIYGPWVTPEWISRVSKETEDSKTWASGSAPNSYFAENPYSIIECYENPGNYEWQTLTPLAEALVNSTTKIVVPVGVDSIDVYGYITENSNKTNVLRYLQSELPEEDYKMYSASLEDAKDGEDSVPGLFSGLFQDYTENTDAEKKYRGNDRVEEIVLEAIKKLPVNAFDSCEKLRKITIGPGCEDIGTAPFRGCENLSEVIIQDNEKYTSSKAIIYSINEDGTYTIEECLPYRGKDSTIAPPVISLANDPNLANVTAIKEGAFEDCNNISAVDLREIKAITAIPKKAFKDCKILSQVFLPETVNSIREEAFAYDMGDDSPSRVSVTIPGNEVHIATDAFEHQPTVTIRSYEGSAAHEYADYHEIGWENLAKTFQVVFLDHDGTQIGETQYIEEGKNAIPPENPTREGHTFVGWSEDYLGVTKDLILVAQYKENVTDNPNEDDPNADDPNKDDPNKDDPNKDDPNKDDPNKDDPNKDDPNNGNNSNNGNSSDKPNDPNTDGKLYTVMVVKGDGGGSYLSGSTVKVIADEPASGQKFSHWSSADGVAFANNNSATTTFVMPKKNVTVTANFVSKSGGNSGTVSSNNKNDGGTKVTINRPGFSNQDLSSATVNGTNDNFIIKITETASATQAVEAALTAEYGSLENIQYFPMDITLWDVTGTTKITDTTGITIDITVPLPDSLVKYGGNNKVAGVVNNRLDKLSPKFTTIDGVPCVTFRATHFSPYTIYVDTTNLTADTIQDSTPKTGDGIHPKWFLAIGLACVSMILFLKKDKVKPANKAKLA